MRNEAKQIFSAVLEGVATVLDIPDHLADDATLRYREVGEWLSSTDSSLNQYLPEIYPQGSFLLGTVVQPPSDDGAYDIDLVCRLELEKEKTAQDRLKKMIGDRLKQKDEYEGRLRESRRCWTLDWKDTFHMDVLPSIPNSERLPTGILLTDTTLVRWQKSNPKQYANWFREQMYTKTPTVLGKAFEASIEAVPEWPTKSPLQRAVQVLKRHRDLYFEANDVVRPISIILTTLAAKAYQHDEDLTDALLGIVDGMASHIERARGAYFVRNPVEPEENFADKWNEDPKRPQAFYSWLDVLRKDLRAWLSELDDLNKSHQLFDSRFGRRVIGTAVPLAEQRLQRRDAIIFHPREDLVPPVSNDSHAQPIPWPLSLSYRVELSGSVHTAQRNLRIWEFSNRPVPKSLAIRFRLSTNAPRPFDVYWQVINTGSEAAADAGLRGQIVKEDAANGLDHWEDTQYRGTHMIEAFIVKDGMCVARTRRRQVRIR